MSEQSPDDSFADDVSSLPPASQPAGTAHPSAVVPDDEIPEVVLMPSDTGDSALTPVLVVAAFLGVFVTSYVLFATLRPRPAAPTVAFVVPPPGPEDAAPVRRRDPQLEAGKEYVDREGLKMMKEFLEGKKPKPLRYSITDIQGPLTDLGAADPEVVRQAAEDLARKVPQGPLRQQVVFALVREAGDPRRLSPGLAMSALQSWALREDLSILLSLVKHSDSEVRQVGVRIIGEWGDPRAADALAALLEDDLNRSAASDALRRIGAPAEAAVSRSLGNARAIVRQEACDILGVIGTPTSALAMRTRTFDQDRDVRKAAERAIAAINARAEAGGK